MDPRAAYPEDHPATAQADAPRLTDEEFEEEARRASESGEAPRVSAHDVYRAWRSGAHDVADKLATRHGYQIVLHEGSQNVTIRDLRHQGKARKMEVNGDAVMGAEGVGGAGKRARRAADRDRRAAGRALSRPTARAAGKRKR